jgi:flagellar hook protein FlgE
VTSAIVYDSLGNEHLVTLTMSLVSRTSAISTWRWYADAADDTDMDLAVGTGTVQFDNVGQYLAESGDMVRVDLDLLGVSTQLVINPDFENITQFASVLGSELNVRSQDGAPMGVLTSYAVAEDGTITGLYTNGLTTELAKLAVTRFSNNNGLLRDAQNMFSAGNNSGLAQDGEALEGGRGAIRAGTLESSNVDIAREFTDLIVTQRGFQANARTVTASDEMLIELINLTR